MNFAPQRRAIFYCRKFDFWYDIPLYGSPLQEGTRDWGLLAKKTVFGGKKISQWFTEGFYVITTFV